MSVLVRTAFFLISLLSVSALAGEALGERPHLVGSGSIGFGSFNVLSPSSDIKMNPGQMYNLQGEKSFGIFHLYLEAMLNYLRTTGNSTYNFTSSTASYFAQNVNFNLDEFQAGFGIRFKFVQNYPVRPYLEGGGTAGYFQMTYDSSIKTPSVLNSGNDFKAIDSALDFGTYCEAGVEIGLTRDIGVRIADRYTDATTRPLDTVKKQLVRYSGNFYVFSLFTYF